MRRTILVVFSFVMMSVAAVPFSMAQKPAEVIPAGSDSSQYLRDQMLLEEIYQTQADVYYLAGQVNDQASDLASSQSAMSAEKAEKIISLANKVEQTSKEVEKKLADAEKKASGKAYERAGLAKKTWEKVEKTAEDIVIEATKQKADKKDLEALKRKTDELKQEMANQLAAIQQEIDKIWTEIAALKAKDIELEAEQERMREERDADKATQAEVDAQQNSRTEMISTEVASQGERLTAAEKKQAEMEKELATKAQTGLVSARAGFMAVASGNADTRMYVITIGGEYIIRKDWLRVGIGGDIGPAFKEDGSKAFFFDSRIRAGHTWNFIAGEKAPAEATLSLYGNTYSSGMPFSDQWGLGGGASLQFDFGITDKPDGVRFTMEIYGGYARDWHTVELDAPDDGGFYQKTRQEASNTWPVGIVFGITF